MQKSNNLTEKEFWNYSWKCLKLPARFFNDYSHDILSKKIDKHVEHDYKNFLEIGGCPGRWSEHFFSRFGMICDSMDYDVENVSLTKRNYRMLGIKGNCFVGDVTNNTETSANLYDVVLSDGLLEHFVDSSKVFKNHLKYLKKEGLLIIGVPNIKKSWFYNYLAKFDKVGYVGYRHVDKNELLKYAQDNELEIFFCGYIGVFNLGLINFNIFNVFLCKLFVAIHILFSFVIKTLKIRKESSIFSPYIFLIAKK